MGLAKTFYLLKDAETRTGELYATIGLSVAIADPELADLLNDLSAEERQHAQQVEMTREYFLQSPDAFLATPDAERTIAGFVENLATVRNYFNQNFAKMRPADVLDLALDIERNLVECHQTFVFKLTDRGIESLFKSLNVGNNDHIRRLQEFKERQSAAPR
jgi:rubrerythrin